MGGVFVYVGGEEVLHGCGVEHGDWRMCPCEDVDERGWISVGEDVRLCGFGATVVECFDAW